MDSSNVGFSSNLASVLDEELLYSSVLDEELLYSVLFIILTFCWCEIFSYKNGKT
jgi:hypothetical protein